MRISQKNENCQGTSGNQSPSQTWPQAPVRLIFPKQARLRTSKDFQRVKSRGRRYHGSVTIIEYFLSKCSSTRYAKIGISVSRRYGTAFRRNLFKRRAREAFRELLPMLPPNLEVNIVPYYNQEIPTKSTIHQDLKDLYRLFIQPA